MQSSASDSSIKMMLDVISSANMFFLLGKVDEIDIACRQNTVSVVLSPRRHCIELQQLTMSQNTFSIEEENLSARASTVDRVLVC